MVCPFVIWENVDGCIAMSEARGARAQSALENGEEIYMI